ncbi:MAG: flagellar biosynthesis protein FliQ [Candidatus Tectomicrobia bacterium]|uniref:Flagellar biosynthetic protein FliQ n=1 Tax=Tectimicrobiota bacterium TaxID=2528274 RepID=A0A932CL82_UNCTE|nr:flagellar biosynthesis protein FliQ [Candidatus Tectomicrobia bacterium]
MTTEFVIGFGRQALEVTLLVSAPMLITALVVGLAISLLQAVTQVQEATVAFIPKIVAVFLALILFGPWIMQTLIDFTRNLFNNIPNYIR